MAEKVTMVIKADLHCYRCYKRIKKVLCKFPEIRDQVFDDKQNKVIITVISCCPERIEQKIYRKGGKSVESIAIIPEKKKEADKPKEGGAEKPKQDEKKKEGGADKPKDGEKKKEGGADKPKDGEKKKDAGTGDKQPKEGEKKKDGDGKPKEGEKKEAQAHKYMSEPVSGYPTIYPGGMHYQHPQPYYGGYGVVPYHQGVPAYYGEGGYGYGGNRGYNMNRCDYFSEESPEGCSVM